MVNQVQRDLNGLGQATTEWQAVSGTVALDTTPKVGYGYDVGKGGRLTAMTYPNGRTISYAYAGGLDDKLSRVTSLSGGGTTLESLTYLGAGAVVKRAHPQGGVDLSYIKLPAESNGDAGDQYTGLDRFGRVVDQRWIRPADSSHVVRLQHAYDRNGSKLYADNLVFPDQSELYHANGAAPNSAYDSYNRLIA